MYAYRYTVKWMDVIEGHLVCTSYRHEISS